MQMTAVMVAAKSRKQKAATGAKGEKCVYVCEHCGFKKSLVPCDGCHDADMAPIGVQPC